MAQQHIVCCEKIGRINKLSERKIEIHKLSLFLRSSSTSVAPPQIAFHSLEVFLYLGVESYEVMAKCLLVFIQRFC
jgi:hypothetical protein